jgi:hypothetical protein
MSTWQKVWDFLKNHQWAWMLVLALLLFGAGTMVGRFTKHPEVQIKEVVKTEVQTKTVIQYQDRIVTQKVYVSTEKKHEHTTETTTKKPDGTVVTQKETTSDEDDSKNAQTNQDAQHNQTQTVTQVVKQTEVVTKTVTNQPNWSVYAGAGVDIPYYLGNAQNGIPGMKGFVVQAGVDRRVAGPFWIGLFGNTEGVTGLNVRGTW